MTGGIDLRRPGWEVAMAAAIQRLRGEVPGWGHGDCGALACAVAAAMGRDDLVPPDHAIARRTKAQALRALVAIGGMAGWLSARCPARPDPLMARRGDFLVVPGDGVWLDGVGVVDLDRVWMLDPVSGLTHATLGEAAARPGAIAFDTGSPLQGGAA